MQLTLGKTRGLVFAMASISVAAVVWVICITSIVHTMVITSRAKGGFASVTPAGWAEGVLEWTMPSMWFSLFVVACMHLAALKRQPSGAPIMLRAWDTAAV